MCRRSAQCRVRMMTTLVAAICLIAIVPREGETQEASIRIADAPSCEACSITLREVASLGGDTSEDGLLCEQAMPAADGAGGFWVAPTCEPGEILRFDRNGAVVARLHRYGEGPEEWRDIWKIWTGRRGALHLFDGAEHVIVAADGEIIGRHRPVRMPNDFDVTGDGRLLIQTMAADSQGAMTLVQLTDSAGVAVKSFVMMPEERRRGGSEHLRSLAMADRGFWLAPFGEYRVEFVDLATGDTERELTRKPDWWTEPAADGTERTWIEGVHVDEGGLLWVLAGVMIAEEWDPAEMSPAEAMDAVIEVIDTRAGRLVTTRRLDTPYLGWINGQYVYTLAETEGGGVVVEVAEMALVQDR